MKPEDVLAHYGTAYLFEKRTKMSGNSLRYWLKKHHIPYGSQQRLELLTDGLLKASTVHTKEFMGHINGGVNMNLRGILKLVDCVAEACTHSNPDNYYTNKISVTHGPSEMPKHDHMYFLDGELESLEMNLNLISKEIRRYLDDNKVNREGIKKD